MKRIDERTVELTDAERVVVEWHGMLLDAGYSQREAVDRIESRVPQDGVTFALVRDPDFRAYLLT